MIKSNKLQQDSILRSGYRNQLKKHSEYSSSNRASQTNKNDFQNPIKSTVSKPKRTINQNQSQSSQRSRNTSAQRALNAAFANSSTQPNGPNKVSFQIQSYVRETLPLAPSEYHYKKAIHRHPSEPIVPMNHSQAGSDVNTQIQTLNRLRQEHDIIKQVTSDDELKDYDGSNVNNSQRELSRRNYIHESRQSVPVQIIRNKTLSSRLVAEVNHSALSNRNPQRQDEKYSIESDDQVKSGSSKNNKSKGKQKDQIPTEQRISHPKRLSSNHEYLIQISSLQSALTQSSLKIQQLLTESIRNKERLRQSSESMQKVYRMQNELKIIRQSEKYLKRQIQMKEEEIQRFQKRTNLMKQTIEMMEREAELKDREVTALQGLVLGGRFGALQRGSHGLSSEGQLDKIREFAREKERMRDVEAISQQQNKARQYQSQGSSHQSSGTLNSKLKQTEQKLAQLQSINFKLTLELQSQKQRSTQYLEQTISSRVRYELAQSSASQNHERGNQSLIERDIQSIRQQLVKLQASNQESSMSSVSELQMKLRELEQVMRAENEEKFRFLKEIQRVKEEQTLNSERIASYARELNQMHHENQSLRQENELIKTQMSALKSYNASLTKLQSQITVNCVPKQQYTQTERERSRLSQEVRILQRELNSNNKQLEERSLRQKAITVKEKQKLIENLEKIKQQYMKLEQAYFDKAKQCEQVKLDLFSKHSSEVQHLDAKISHFHQELEAERQFSQQLQQKVHQKEFQLIEFLNFAENTNAYNDKIAELHKNLSGLEIKLKEKDFQMAQLIIQHKKLLHQQKQSLNQIHLQLSQKTLELIELKNSLQEQQKIHSHQKLNLSKQLHIIKQELQEQQQHHQLLSKMDQDMALEQVKLLETQILTMAKEKEKLMEETLKMSQLQYHLKILLIKEKNNRKLNQKIDHLWMIKEAEYFNINQILHLSKSNQQDIQSEQKKSNEPIRISENY